MQFKFEINIRSPRWVKRTVSWTIWRMHKSDCWCEHCKPFTPFRASDPRYRRKNPRYAVRLPDGFYKFDYLSEGVSVLMNSEEQVKMLIRALREELKNNA